MKTKLFKTILTTTLVIAFLAACGTGGGATTPAPAPAPPADNGAAAEPAADNGGTTAEPTADNADFSYPMDFSGTITYWKPMAVNWSTYLTNFGESAFSRALIEATGIDIEWIHPPQGQHMESFSIMVASGNFPDVIEWRWHLDFPGGPAGALADRLIIPLNDATAQWAPNYRAMLEREPHLYRQVVTDDGQHFAFPFLRNAEILKTTTGPIVRMDWLNELGLDIPETLDDWENMLRLFRDEKGASIGFTGVAASGDPNGLYFTFLPAFGVRAEFFVEGSEIIYGITHDNFRSFLELMARWYSEELIDRNIISTTRPEMDAAILSGDSGAVVGPGGGAFGPWLLAAWENEPGTSYDLTATRFPTINRNELVRHGGTSPDLGTGSQGHAAISSSATEIEAITRLLDFGYSEEGHMLYNFGIYGVSWEMVNGEPILTDMVTNNPDGRTFAQALSYFARAAINGPFDQDPRYLLQFYALDQQKAALDFWTMQNNSDQTILPPITLTQSEAQTVSARMADIDTYRREWIARFITGADPVTDDTWGNFVDTLYGMGLEEVTAIHQAALDRYNSR